jgi:hypothetical protein
MSAKKWIIRAFDEGLITDIEKFTKFMEENNLSIGIDKVECIDNEGRIVMVIYDSSEIFTCCSCSSLTINTDGKTCVICNNLMCYNCSNGQPIHLCSYDNNNDLLSECESDVYLDSSSDSSENEKEEIK